MCTRTKTSYGCGHVHKTDDECKSRSCNGIERYHILREGDCRECKYGGHTVTRGKEGKGRYAQELKIKTAPPATPRKPLSSISPNTRANPWAPPKPREREWHSPVRRAADDAWLREHAKREMDLESRSQENLSRSSHSPTVKQERHRDDLFDEAEHIRVRRRPSDRPSSHDSYDAYVASPTQPRGRSYTPSFRAMPPPPPPPQFYQATSDRGLGYGLADVFREDPRRWHL